MRWKTALGILLLAVMLIAPFSALAKIVPTPQSVNLGSSEIGFVSIDCDGKTVSLVLSGFDGRLRIKNNKLVLSYQAHIIVDGKPVKWKTGNVEGENYIYTYKAKKLPDSILVFHPEDEWSWPYSEAVITLTDDEYIPVSDKTEFAGYTVSMTSVKKLFKGKGNFSNAFRDLNVGSDIMLKGSSLPKNFFLNSKQGQSMLLVPVTLKVVKGQQKAENLAEALSTAKMSDGTALYDLWYNDQECCFVFDTAAYEGKELGVTVIDSVLTFGYLK